MNETAQNPLPLLTPGQGEQLLANGRQSGRNHVPVVKFSIRSASAPGLPPNAMQTATSWFAWRT